LSKELLTPSFLFSQSYNFLSGGHVHHLKISKVAILSIYFLILPT